MNYDLTKLGLLVKDKYRFLNETLTEEIACEIAKIMKNKNQIVFTNKQSLIKTSKYSILSPLGRSLIANFKDDLPKMKFGCEEELYSVIDKNTLTKLEDLCNYYYKNKYNKKRGIKYE